MELLLDPEMVKKHKSGSAKVESALLTSTSSNRPNADANLEWTNSKFHSFDVFLMRGFGEFDHSLGVGSYSERRQDSSIRASTGEAESCLTLAGGFRPQHDWKGWSQTDIGDVLR